MEPRFEQFIRERLYLHNVAPTTAEWYKHSFKWLETESPDDAELKAAVMRMRDKGLKATGCNSAIRAINAYLKWSESPLKIPQLKEPQLILPTFTTVQITRLVSWKPKGSCQRRLHLLVLMLFVYEPCVSRTMASISLSVADFFCSRSLPSGPC